MATELLGVRLLGKKTSVGTTATKIPATALTGRQSIDILNDGSNIIFIGDSTVTTANGYPLAAGESKVFDAADGCVIYGRVVTGTEDARSLEGK